MPLSARLLAIAAPLVLATPGAYADVVISSGATQNMNCSGGVCAPTAAGAVLNVGDLESLLATGSVEITTIGSTVQTDNLRVTAPLTWSGTAALTLDARRSVIIDKPVDVTGSGTLAILTGGKTGTFSIEGKGHVQFPAGGGFSINGASYMLVNSISALASAIAANPSGDYALAENYDASADGTYTSSPIPKIFYGIFDGLGNSIRHLSISAAKGTEVGLFSYVYNVGPASVQHLGLEYAKIAGTGKNQFVGGVAGDAGNLYEDHVSGTIEVASGGAAGGLAGNASNISFSHSIARVIGQSGSTNVGSLVGQGGEISDSYATGNVAVVDGGCVGGLAGTAQAVNESFATGEARAAPTATNKTNSAIGGLVGCGGPEITNSYSTGAAISRIPAQNTKKSAVYAGGLIGYMVGTISYSYSSGRVHGSSRIWQDLYGTFKGGLAGTVQQNGSKSFTDTYWDTTTSTENQGSSNDWSGITGLTTTQLQSGLPSGFDPAIWAENPEINNGFPYLIANPPPK